MTAQPGRFDGVDAREHQMLGDKVLDMIRGHGIGDPETLVTVAISVLVCALATERMDRGGEAMEDLRDLALSILARIDVPDEAGA